MLIYPSYPVFAQVVRYWRKKRRITQSLLAEGLGMTPKQVYWLEHGDYRPDFTWDQLQILSRLLKITMEQLLDGEQSVP